MAHKRVVAEDHTDFLLEALGAVKGTGDGRALYGQRPVIMTGIDTLFVNTYVPSPLRQLLQKTQIGPRHIIQVDNVFEYLMSGEPADVISNSGELETFWHGTPQYILRHELNINGWINPSRMLKLNCKTMFRQIAEAMGVPHVVPPHRICYTLDEAQKAFRELWNYREPGLPVHDALIAKCPRLLAGAGISFVRTMEELNKFCEKYLSDGEEIILEVAWRCHIPFSIHYNIEDTGLSRAGVTGQVMRDGTQHAGNIISHDGRGLGLSPADIELLYAMSAPIAWFWHRMGYRGSFGVDAIRANGLCGNSRMFIIEPNAFRPPAPRYIMSLSEKIGPRLPNGWAIAMSDVYCAPGAAGSFNDLARLLCSNKRRWGDLMFDGITGVIPMLTGLLPEKFIAVCVGRSPTHAQMLLQQIQQLVTGRVDSSLTLARVAAENGFCNSLAA